MQEEAFNGVIKYVRLSALRVLDDGEKACTSNDARLYWLEMNMTECIFQPMRAILFGDICNLLVVQRQRNVSSRGSDRESTLDDFDN